MTISESCAVPKIKILGISFCAALPCILNFINKLPLKRSIYSIFIRLAFCVNRTKNYNKTNNDNLCKSISMHPITSNTPNTSEMQNTCLISV